MTRPERLKAVMIKTLLSNCELSRQIADMLSRRAGGTLNVMPQNSSMILTKRLFGRSH
jgi:hypothetical protein